ncbi:hypothetical protein J4E91_009943 [Alternaria rosae]|nr:hypothetical protein J4E91_009943 [Alternaria rosae]
MGLMRSLSDFPRYYFYFCWPDKKSEKVDDWTAGRVGWTCDAQWANIIYLYLFDGGWRGDGALIQRREEDTEQIQRQLAKERRSWVKKNGLQAGDSAGRDYTDSERILSFWVTGGQDDKAPRTIDPTGLDPNGRIQLNRKASHVEPTSGNAESNVVLISAKMYAKRKARDKGDYEGNNVTQEAIGLPKPVKVATETPEDEFKKIELLLDLLAAGLPEVSVLGRETWVDAPLPQQKEIDDLATFIRGGN